MTGLVSSTSGMGPLAAGRAVPTVVMLTDGPGILIDARLGNVFEVTLGGNRVLLDPVNPADGQPITVRVTQGAGGPWALTYGPAWNFGAAGAPTLSTAANAMDILGAQYVASRGAWCYLGSGPGF